MGGLGFRRLREFNIAMLGKQAWRLIKNPESLVAKVYKARYYPKVSFLEAKIGGCPSFIWRSILEFQSAIREGMRWRVGDGQRINVWNDPWLPDKGNCFIQTVKLPHLDNITVSSLFATNSCMWDLDILNDIFEDRDKYQIMSIPLPVHQSQDKMIWKWEEKGDYSVKSCYQFLMGNMQSEEDMCWTTMWNLDIPPKVKLFFWQTCVNCLPTTDNLQAKQVPCSQNCLLCSTGLESSTHIFLNCEFARNCWRATGINVNIDNHPHFQEWIMTQFCMLDEEKRCLFILYCWSIWKARNAKLWNNQTPSLHHIIESANIFLQNWREAKNGIPQRFPRCANREERWQKPSTGWLKLNVDAALNTPNKTMGFGCFCEMSMVVLLQPEAYHGRVFFIQKKLKL